ncbi:MAG: hypothetical protein R6W83_09240 [Cryobacterium sp.]
MRTYSSIREVVRGTGATLVEEHLHPEAFGSAYGVFVGRAGARFRLVWDGKEGLGFLQLLVAPDEWKNQGPTVRERVGSKFSNLPQFLATAESLAEGGSRGAVVYVALLGEGTEVWRPVAAIEVSTGHFRLLGSSPVEESWQFPPGALVRCEPHVFSGGEQGLVAVEAADA